MGFIPSERSAKLGTGSHPDSITYSLPKGSAEKIPARMVYVKSHVDDKRLRIIDLQFFDRTGVEVYKTNIFGFLAPNNSDELAKNMQKYSTTVKYLRAHGMPLSLLHPQ